MKILNAISVGFVASASPLSGKEQRQALLALKQRSEQRLVEQQQLSTIPERHIEEEDLLLDIRSLRSR